MGPSVNPALVQSALKEDEGHKKTSAYCVRLPHNQHLVLSAYANSAGIEVPAIIRRIVRDWIAKTSS